MSPSEPSRLAGILRFFRPYRRALTGLLLLTVSLSLIVMMPPLIIRAIIDRVIGRGEIGSLPVFGAALFLLPFIISVGGIIQTRGIAFIGQHFVFDLRTALYGHILAMSMRFFGRNSAGMLVNRLMGDTGAMFGHSPEPVARALEEQARRGFTAMLPGVKTPDVGAALAREGKAIIALPATARKGTVSRITPTLKAGAGVVTTRGHVHWVVTEFGAVNLHGRTLRERGEEIPEGRVMLLEEVAERNRPLPDEPRGVQVLDLVVVEGRVPRVPDERGGKQRAARDPEEGLPLHRAPFRP